MIDYLARVLEGRRTGSPRKVSLTIDGKVATVPDDYNLIEAAATVGVFIPYFCWHPHLAVAGNCRMCLVDVQGGRKPEIACNMRVREGMVVFASTERVRGYRRSVMEFLLANHPLDCPICDQSGECLLQDFWTDHARHPSRLQDPKVTRPKRIDLGEHIVLDCERCIACTRCVRFLETVTGSSEMAIWDRSDHWLIGTWPGSALQNGYQGCLADICPVGALTHKDFRFRKRVWYLEETPSICTRCATGCNIRVCHERGVVHRIIGRRNDEVNRSWICDLGRLSYKEIAADDRLLLASVDGRPTRAVQAVGEVGRALDRARKQAPERIGLVFGNQAENEANFALLELARRYLGAAHFFTCEGNDPGQPAIDDGLLLHRDRNPNTAGAAILLDHARRAGFRVGERDDLDVALRRGSLALLLVVADDVVGRLRAAWSAEGSEQRPELLALAQRRSATTEAAHVVLPIAHPIEEDATFLNAGQRVQRSVAAVAPPGDALSAWQALDRTAAVLGGDLGLSGPEGAFARMAAEVPAFFGLDFAALGIHGLPATSGTGQGEA
jgi:NADH-quinone oxidoreductase subunit G